MEAAVVDLLVGMKMDSGKGTGSSEWRRGEAAAERPKDRVLLQRTISDLKIIFAAIIMVFQTQSSKSKRYQKARWSYHFPNTISS